MNKKISLIMVIMSLVLVSSVLGAITISDVSVGDLTHTANSGYVRDYIQINATTTAAANCTFNITNIPLYGTMLGAGTIAHTNVSLNVSAYSDGLLNVTVTCINVTNSSDFDNDYVEVIKDTQQPSFQFNWWTTTATNGSSVTFANNKNFTLQDDIFYSPYENIINFSVNVTDNLGVGVVQVNLTNMTTTISGYGGTCGDMLNLTLSSGLWIGNCSLGDFNYTTLNGVQSFTIYFTAYDESGYVAYPLYNVSNSSQGFNFPNADSSLVYFPINLHDFGVPEDDLLEGLAFGPLTTNFSQETDFSDINLILDIDINLSAWSGSALFPGEFLSMVLMNFTSLDFNSPATAANIGALVDAIDFDFVAPGQFGNSRLYVNSTAFAALNSNATITFRNLPFMTQPNVTGDVPGEFLGVTSWVSAYSSLFNTTVGNLTFTVSGFSGYNISDIVDPVVNIDYPIATRYGSNLTLINFTVNGTGSEPSYVTVTVNGSQYVFNNSIGGENTANCTNVSADQETWRCLTTVNVGEGSQMVLINARDFGGSVGNTDSSNVSFIIDATAPVIIATNQTVAYGSAFSYDVNATDDDSNIVYQITDNVNFTINSSTGVLTNHTALSLQVYDFTINATDSVGNVGEKMFSVTVADETNPQITAVTKQTINYSDAFGYQIIASDNINVSSYWVSDTTNFAINTTGYLSNNTLLGVGIYSLTVYVNDTSGNQNSTIFDVSVKNVNTTAVNGTSPEINLTESNTSIVFDINASVNLTVEVEEYEVNTSASTTVSIAGVNSSKIGVKARNISIDAASRGNLTWAYVKIYYNDSEISGLDESSLKMYYFNTSSSQWEQVTDSGVDTVNNFVWGNVTHFSVYGLFASTATTTTTTSSSSSSSSSGGSGAAYTFSDGEKTVNLRYGQAFYFDLINARHTVIVKSNTADSITLQIRSEPIIVTLKKGESTKVDVDKDGVYDIKITLNDLISGGGNITFEMIEEKTSAVVEEDRTDESYSEPVVDEKVPDVIEPEVNKKVVTTQNVTDKGVVVDKETNFGWTITGIILICGLIGYFLYRKFHK